MALEQCKRCIKGQVISFYEERRCVQCGNIVTSMQEYDPHTDKGFLKLKRAAMRDGNSNMRRAGWLRGKANRPKPI